MSLHGGDALPEARSFQKAPGFVLFGSLYNLVNEKSNILHDPTTRTNAPELPEAFVMMGFHDSSLIHAIGATVMEKSLLEAQLRAKLKASKHARVTRGIGYGVIVVIYALVLFSGKSKGAVMPASAGAQQHLQMSSETLSGRPLLTLPPRA